MQAVLSFLITVSADVVCFEVSSHLIQYVANPSRALFSTIGDGLNGALEKAFNDGCKSFVTEYIAVQHEGLDADESAGSHKRHE
jgi:hypothetical protein